MIDFHAHFLPDIDDGCSDVNESIEVLKLMKSYNCNIVVATPHFYATDMMINDFLEKRQNAYEQVIEEASETSVTLPVIILGSEVKFFYGMSMTKDIDRLCIGNTRFILVELPFERWDESVYQELNNLAVRQGVIPIIAHLDKYRRINDVFNAFPLFEYPIQLNATVFNNIFYRKKWVRFMFENSNVIFGSDAHNMQNRKPNLNLVTDFITQKIGARYLKRIAKTEMSIINT